MGINCVRCGDPIAVLGQSKNGYHLRCWRIKAGQLRAEPKPHHKWTPPKPRTRPGKHGFQFTVYTDAGLFTEVREAFLAGPRDRSFSHFINVLIKKGLHHATP